MWIRRVTLLSPCVVIACGAEVGPPDPAPPSLFSDITAASGLRFRHANDHSEQFRPPEIMGAGAALFDCDDDGDLDAFLVQGGSLRALDRVPSPDVVFRNLGGNPPRFEAATDSGIDDRDFGMGVATGDVDNDGRIDLYVTNFGKNRLYRNLGGCRFADVSATSGTADPEWSVPAVFLDFDRDGLLDLFVGNYLRFSVDRNVVCRTSTGEPDYCAPTSYPAAPHRLFRNLGGLRFEDVTSTGLTDAVAEPALGAVAADFNRDGWPDLYVANDGRPNHLWLNQKNGGFREVAASAGAAVNQDGRAEASMGVQAFDVDGDCDLDLFLTHLVGETNTLYKNRGDASFDDATASSGLGPPSRMMTGFGTVALDFDADGDSDLMVVNGAVRRIETLHRLGDPFPFHQAGQLFLNDGTGRFKDWSDAAGDEITRSIVGRGLASGDLDNDGDIDLLVTTNGGDARVLLREGHPEKWIGVRLVNRQGRDDLGAIVEMDDGTNVRLAHAHTDGSYASACDPRVVFALNRSVNSASARITWSDGTNSRFSDLATNVYHTLIELSH